MGARITRPDVTASTIPGVFASATALGRIRALAAASWAKTGRYRVVVLGDSTVYGYNIDDWRFTWPEILRKLLNSPMFKVQPPDVTDGCFCIPLAANTPPTANQRQITDVVNRSTMGAVTQDVVGYTMSCIGPATLGSTLTATVTVDRRLTSTIPEFRNCQWAQVVHGAGNSSSNGAAALGGSAIVTGNYANFTVEVWDTVAGTQYGSTLTVDATNSGGAGEVLGFKSALIPLKPDANNEIRLIYAGAAGTTVRWEAVNLYGNQVHASTTGGAAENKLGYGFSLFNQSRTGRHTRHSKKTTKDSAGANTSTGWSADAPYMAELGGWYGTNRTGQSGTTSADLLTYTSSPFSAGGQVHHTFGVDVVVVNLAINDFNLTSHTRAQYKGYLEDIVAEFNTLGKVVVLCRWPSPRDTTDGSFWSGTISNPAGRTSQTWRDWTNVMDELKAAYPNTVVVVDWEAMLSELAGHNTIAAIRGGSTPMYPGANGVSVQTTPNLQTVFSYFSDYTHPTVGYHASFAHLMAQVLSGGATVGGGIAPAA